MDEKGTYEVVWPRGRQAVGRFRPARRLDTLEGKTIGELSNRIFRADEVFPLVEKELSSRYPGINFINYDVFDSAHGREDRVMEELPGMLKQDKCDAVISGVGC